MSTVRVLHSVTRVNREHRGAVVVSGSHGGRYPAYLAAAGGLRAVIFNDAGVGKDEAGIAGIAWLGELGLPAVAVSHLSARIGDGQDTLSSGLTSVVNEPARRLGCLVGETAQEASAKLAAAGEFAGMYGAYGEARELVCSSPPEVVVTDSASLVDASDHNRIVVTGSHGALLGNDPGTALKSRVLAAVFNDAGGGPDGRGATRLKVLADRGIPAATVDASTARIGEGQSTWRDGVISLVNVPASTLGVHAGMTACRFVHVMRERRSNLV